MSRPRRLILLIFGMTTLLTPHLRAQSPSAPATRKTFTNPIGPGPDPWIFFYQGNFYYTFTTGRTIVLRKSPTLAGLNSASEILLYQPPDNGPDADNLWAPELHPVDGRWYVYYTATDGPDAHHRIFTLRSRTIDPQGPYDYTGPVKNMSDDWAIDATLLTLHHKLYLLWSGWINPPDPKAPDSPGGPQSIYIAPLSDPLTAVGPRVLLSQPTQDWETQGWKVNEGPEVLQRDGKTFVVFSASLAATRHYCLGLLTLTGNDPLDPRSWTKSPQPIFGQYQGPDGAVYGPGHCSFFKSPDGRQDWIAYHAKDVPQRRWLDRNTRAQPFTWNPDGNPRFGHPIPSGVPLPEPAGEATR